tara:strand:- start:1572 stop:2465 length:894 start_codon:yes stop_codon:yes gene_type:complete
MDDKLSTCQIFFADRNYCNIKEPKMTEKRAELVDALARGLSVIEAFDENDPEMTLSAVAHKTNLSPATARRILRTLQLMGYVGSLNKRFFLLPRVLGLGSAFMRSTQTEDALLPELRRLVDLFGDAASVGILSGADVFYLAHTSDQRAIRPVAGLGVSYPLYATSMGKILLSGQPQDSFENYLAQTERDALTSATITDPDGIRAEVSKAAKQGYATVRDELAYGVTALAVPIFLPSEGIVAAVNTSGYSGHVTPEKLVEDRLEEMRISARRIAETLLRYPVLRNGFIGGTWPFSTTA